MTTVSTEQLNTIEAAEVQPRAAPPSLALRASMACEDLEAAGVMLGEAMVLEMQLADERPLVKREAVTRVMAAHNMAATPAEKLVELDEIFMAHRRKEYAAVLDVQRARAAFHAADHRARLSVALVHTTHPAGAQ
jgi:hypothetical protein